MTDNTGPEILDRAAMLALCAEFDGWTISEDGLAFEKTYEFKGFNAAFAFMTRVALAAERANHHPEWSNVYNRVVIRWTTHSHGGATTLDARLIRKCEAFASG